jgi:hypothetical protein
MHIQTMNTLRKIYRNPLVESVLILGILSQIFSGIKMIMLSKATKPSFFELTQKWSGIYMVFFFCVHLSAIFVGRYIFQIDTNFYFGVAGLNSFPQNLFFIPYYGLAIISFFAHVASVHHIKMKHHLFGLATALQSKLILSVGIIVSFLILYGSTNGFKGFKVPSEYNFKNLLK